MATVLMTVSNSVKAGILSLAEDTNHVHGNGAAGSDFTFPNDGKTVLIVDGVTGDTFTFTHVDDKYGRSEALAPVVAAGKWAMIGPFLPELWNDAAGLVHFVPTVGNANDILLAVRVSNPT